MKKFLSVLLSIVLVSTVVAVSATTAPEMTGIAGSEIYYYRTAEVYSEAITTFEAVIRLPEGFTENAGYIMGNQGYKEEFYNFRINTNGMPHMYIRDEDYVHDEYKFNKVNIATGEWVHLAIVRDTESGLMKCYVDGKYAQSLPLSDKTYVKSTVPYAIGGDFTELNSNCFKGEINSIKLYSDIRTPSEVMSDTVSVDEDNLIAYYDFSNITPGTDMTVEDKGPNGYDAEYRQVWIDEEPAVSEFDYSMIIVGDQQYLNRLYGDAGDMDTMYNHIVNFSSNPDNKMKYLFNMGDITDQSSQAEWDRAVKGFDMLTAAGIDYSFVRGNHDTVDTFNANLNYDKYGEGVVDGSFEGDLRNCYRKVEIDGIKYLMLVLDYAVSSEALEWANGVVESHPDYNVIVATHGYATPENYDSLTFWTSDDTTDYYYAENDGPQIWDKFISKHENISLVLCGHTLTKTVATRTDIGDNGNTVTTMLVNPQETDNVMKKAGYEHGSGLVAHLYFSNEGRDVQVRYYSTVLQKWFRSESQFSLTLDMMGDDYLSGADFR